MFRGTPGNGFGVYDAWVNGYDVTTDDVTCQQLSVTSCNDHYRNPIVDSWNTLNIAKVSLN